MATPPFIVKLRRKIGNDLLFVPTVVVICRDSRGRLLLVHDAGLGLWTLPGGIIEPDEVPSDAAVREVWEETSVQIKLTGLLGVIGGPGCGGIYRNGDQLAWVASVFYATPTEGAPRGDGQETTHASFFESGGIKQLGLNAHAQLFLEAEAKATGGAYFAPATWRPDSAA